MRSGGTRSSVCTVVGLPEENDFGLYTVQLDGTSATKECSLEQMQGVTDEPWQRVTAAAAAGRSTATTTAGCTTTPATYQPVLILPAVVPTHSMAAAVVVEEAAPTPSIPPHHRLNNPSTSAPLLLSLSTRLQHINSRHPSNQRQGVI